MRLRLVAGLLFLFAATPLLAQAGKDKKDTIDFQKQIWPIFESSCIKCHATAGPGPDGKLKKPKGGVVLDSKEGITTSKKGKLVVQKKPADSLIYAAITLAADHEDRMPPAKEGDPLQKEKTDLIQQWIEQGAGFGTWTGKAKVAADQPKEDQPKGGKTGDKPTDKPKVDGKDKPKLDPLVRLQQGLKPLAAATLEALANGPFHATSLGDGSPLLRVSCAGHTDEVGDAAAAALLPLAEHITELDLGRSRVGDGACAVIAKMPRLTVLDLRQSQVGDHGVAALAACRELRSLNLFGTKAGDYGLAALAALKHLEHLYVWQTEVTAKAIVRLRESVPDLRIVMAAELPEPMADAPGNGRRRPQKK